MISRTLKNFAASLALGGAFFATSQTAQAVELTAGLTAIPGVTWNGLPANSFDSPAQNAFYAQIAPYIEQQAYELPALFSGTGTGTTLNYLMFVEITAYEGQNELQLCRNGSFCNTVFAPGDSPAETDQSLLLSSTDYLFKLIAGSGTEFFSDETLNPDLLTHFVAFKVTQDKELDVSPVNISGNPVSVHLDLKVGDLLIGAEDLAGLVGHGSDRDYNDLFFQVRSLVPTTTGDLPEPMTLSLFSLGLLGAARLRSKKNAA